MLKRFLQVLLVLPALVSCTQTPNPRATRSLRASSDVSFVCVAETADGHFAGRPRDACPDFGQLADGEQRRLLALATQTETGEVAVVDMSSCVDGGDCSGRILDLERTQPGINFLPVGAEPVSIASSPGGVATFVSVAESGQQGIYALPTSCIGPRPAEAAYRDLRTWSACRLPSAPGEMQVVVDDKRSSDCSGERREPDTARECPADLSLEFARPGRRKLVVAMPSAGELWVLDAQTLLDLPPGGFDACPVETRVPLRVELPSEPAEQAVPDEWASDESCQPPMYRLPPSDGRFEPRPSDLAVGRERLFVSDLDAPVVHVLDTSDWCTPEEIEPLLPTSYTRPGSVVTTRRLAVSPETSDGRTYIYAVDGSDGPTAGSLMVFDVSPGASQRTPLLRPRSDYISLEPPDRIQFSQEVRDVEFAFQDLPEPDPKTGVAREGLMCEPDPDRNDSPGAAYRPNTDGTGAAPAKLRGVFAFAALQSGFVTVIDVDDLDGPCRRPMSVNRDETSDIRGCANDPYDEDLLRDRSGTPTVSDELSCNIVVPHRARAASFINDDPGGSAPFLRTFPQLRSRDGTSLSVDTTERGRNSPRLIGVNFSEGSGEGRSSSGDAQVLVGATLYQNEPGAPDRLMLDPALSERNSLILPFVEPRAYSGVALNTITFEGVVRGRRDAPYQVRSGDELGAGLTGTYGVFGGGLNARFCASGVEDQNVMRGRGQELLPEASDSLLDEFGRQYGDYVEIVQQLLDEDHRYWAEQPGRSCGAKYLDQDQRLSGFQVCELFFGTEALPDPHRELRIVRAFDDRLVVEPRLFETRSERNAVVEMVSCCFPGGVDIVVRGSQQWIRRQNGEFEHSIVANAETLACEADCSPLARHREGRAFEIACDGAGCADNATGERVIGPSNFFADDDEAALEPSDELSRALACVIGQHPGGGVQPTGPGSECIYDSLTARFVIYRGLAPSQRDMQFSWTTSGGFTPLAVDLFGTARFLTTTMPQAVEYVPEMNRLVIADGGSTGLSYVGLRRRDGGPGLSAGVAF